MSDMAVQERGPDSKRVVTRRAFLGAGASTGGALMVGFYAPWARGIASVKPVFAPNAFIRIDYQGKITLIMPQVEMGQGVYTSIAMILAEELVADFNQVALEAAPPSDKLYGNPTFHLQATGNSNSIRAFWMPLRKAAAGTRAILVQAAAQVWKVDPSSIRTDESTAIHDASGRRLAYADLIGRAGGLLPPKEPLLKDTQAFKLIGRPLKRLDTPDKHAAGREICHRCSVSGIRRQDRASQR
jgi:isoquinoline 1-oxidoreductase subunit beta